MTEIERVAQDFERFDLSTGEPKWSSWALDRLLETALVPERGTMTAALGGFDLALKRNNIHLKDSVAHLVQDVVKAAFTGYGPLYAAADWGWVHRELASGVGAARAYLFLHALPPDQLTPGALAAILRGLDGTSFLAEALLSLADDLRHAIRLELQEDGVARASNQIDAFFQSH